MPNTDKNKNKNKYSPDKNTAIASLNIVCFKYCI
jgi:hypothetical protein